MSPIQPIQVQLQRAPHSYPIHFRGLEDLPQLMREANLNAAQCVLVTDANVEAVYGDSVVDTLETAGRRVLKIAIPAGESSKSLEHLRLIYDKVLETQIDRQTPVIALGGGVVGDLAGFAAATLLRGVPLVQVPTTLIGQADSAIGGKTGINHATGKNLVGAFYQPKFVCTDLDTLQSLPQREWTSGLAEILKYAFISDPELYTYLRNQWTAVLNRRPDAVTRIVPRSAAIKADIVEKDERESGLRAILNFGHTVGHAIEKAGGYGRFTHGEAIALGMIAALHLSHTRGADLSLEETVALVQRLPRYASLEDLTFENIWDIMHSDKKVKDGQIRYILLETVGSPYVTADVSREAVRKAWEFTKECAKSHPLTERS